jgi:two-component system CheB/CheR fusion protein
MMVALDALAKQSEASSGIACRFECEPPVHVEDSGTAVQLYRIAQEAVHNAVRHAEATQIVVTLTRKEQRLEIAVSDDGRGLDDRPAGHPGIGLASMHQRARLLGGDCSIEPRDEGSGTVVMCWVPSPERVEPETRAPKTGSRTNHAASQM